MNLKKTRKKHFLPAFEALTNIHLGLDIVMVQWILIFTDSNLKSDDPSYRLISAVQMSIRRIIFVHGEKSAIYSFFDVALKKHIFKDLLRRAVVLQWAENGKIVQQKRLHDYLKG